jgi:hypothetical protein
MTISYELKSGSHESREAGMCAMEWVAYIAGEGHTDSPVCVDVALRRFSIGLNDALPHDLRQQLRPYLARMVGTANDGLQQKRLFMLADWAVHVPAVEALEAAGRKDLADSLRAVPPVVDVKSARAAYADAADAAADADADAAAYAADAVESAALRCAVDAAIAAADAADAAADAAATAGAVADARGVGGGGVVYAVNAARRAMWERLLPSALGLLDRMLPTETVEIPTEFKADYERLVTA